MGRSGCSARASPCCSSFCSFSAISSGKSRTHRGMAVAPRRHIRPLHALEPGTALEAGALVHTSIEVVDAMSSTCCDARASTICCRRWATSQHVNGSDFEGPVFTSAGGHHRSET